MTITQNKTVLESVDVNPNGFYKQDNLYFSITDEKMSLCVSDYELINMDSIGYFYTEHINFEKAIEITKEEFVLAYNRVRERIESKFINK